jgi:hypothetical protein
MNSTRRSGLTIFLVGAVVTAGICWYGMKLGENGGKLIGLGWGVPAVVAMVGLIQLVSGVPFSDLSGRWDALEGWQRGVLGTLFLLLACGVIFLAIFAYVTIAYDS